MKKEQIKSLLVVVAAFFGLLVFVFSFLAAFRVSAGTNWIEYRGFIWGAKTIADEAGNSKAISVGAVALPLIGAILALVGGLCALVVSLSGKKLVKDNEVRKIVVFVAAGLMVLGGVFCFIYKGGLENALVKYYDVSDFKSVELIWKADLLSSTYITSCALPTISGILAILGGCSACASEFVK